MRLGDVLSETDEAKDDAPKPRRRFGLWIALWLLLGLGALSWAHGPVVLFPEPDEAVVIYNPEGWSIFGPGVLTVVDKPFIPRLPLLQRYARIDTAPREVEVDARVSARGVAVRLAGGRVSHRVRAPDASRVVLSLGTDPAVRDRLVSDLARATWAAAIAELQVADLADPAHIAARLDAAGEQFADRAAAFGIDASVATRPAVEIDPAVSGMLARIGEMETRLDERRTGTGAQTERESADRAALERRHRAEATAARATLQARWVEASGAAARARVEAERAYAARIAAAEVEQHTLLAEARVIEAEARADAAAARARVAAIGQNGPRILDHVIATEVMPQLERIRTGSATPSLPVVPLPPPPPALSHPADDPEPPIEAEPTDADAPTPSPAADAPAPTTPEEVRP